MHDETRTMLHRLPVHRASLRPFSFMGMEREMGLLLVLAIVLIAFSALQAGSFRLLLIGAALWAILFAAFKGLARADPMMSRVYLRHIRYQALYDAHSTPHRVNR